MIWKTETNLRFQLVSDPYSLDSGPDLSWLFGESGFWSGSRSRFSMIKNWKKIHRKDFQATKEASCPIKQASIHNFKREDFFTSFFFPAWILLSTNRKDLIGTVGYRYLFEENYMWVYKRAEEVKITDLSSSHRQKQNLKSFVILGRFFLWHWLVFCSVYSWLEIRPKCHKRRSNFFFHCHIPVVRLLYVFSQVETAALKGLLKVFRN